MRKYMKKCEKSIWKPDFFVFMFFLTIVFWVVVHKTFKKMPRPNLGCCSLLLQLSLQIGISPIPPLLHDAVERLDFISYWPSSLSNSKYALNFNDWKTWLQVRLIRSGMSWTIDYSRLIWKLKEF